MHLAKKSRNCIKENLSVPNFPICVYWEVKQCSKEIFWRSVVTCRIENLKGTGRINFPIHVRKVWGKSKRKSL